MDHKTILNLMNQLKSEKQPKVNAQEEKIDLDDEAYEGITKQERL